MFVRLRRIPARSLGFFKPGFGISGFKGFDLRVFFSSRTWSDPIPKPETPRPYRKYTFGPSDCGAGCCGRKEELKKQALILTTYINPDRITRPLAPEAHAQFPEAKLQDHKPQTARIKTLSCKPQHLNLKDPPEHKVP